MPLCPPSFSLRFQVGQEWRPTSELHATGDVSYARIFCLCFQEIQVFHGPIAGALANFGANWLGNYPWFATYNTLQSSVPQMTGAWRYARNGLIGICASCVSDVTSNSLRVIKTVKQVSGSAGESYADVAKQIVAKDGLRGLFGRGLATRLATNAVQGMMFSVVWKAVEEHLNARGASSG